MPRVLSCGAASSTHHRAAGFIIEVVATIVDLGARRFAADGCARWRHRAGPSPRGMSSPP